MARALATQPTLLHLRLFPVGYWLWPDDDAASRRRLGLRRSRSA